MTSLLQQIDRFWYRPLPALRLAVLRVLVGAYATLLVLIRLPSFSSVLRFGEAEFKPLGPVALLDSPLSPALVYGSIALTLLSGVLFVLGFRFRFTGPLFAAMF